MTNADYYVNAWSGIDNLYRLVQHPTCAHAECSALDMRSQGWNNRIGVWHVRLKSDRSDGNG